MSIDQEPTLADMSGESTYKGKQALQLNELSLNGDGAVKEVSPGNFVRQGGFFRKRVLIGKARDERPEEINLGDRIEVVFLKIRRKLVERGNKDGEIIRSTNEHTHKGEAVTLFDSRTNTKTFGVAADLRERHEGLRTVQIVYALLLQGGKQELVRLVVKGASLGSEAKAEGVMDFYRYIGSFGKDEHFYEYKTVLTPVLEEGKQPYFAINFMRGDRLHDDAMVFVVQRMKEVHANCVEIDATRAAKMVTADIPVEEQPKEDFYEDAPVDDAPPLIDESTGEVNPDDIPF